MCARMLMTGDIHGVDSPINNLDDLIKNDKGSLQTRQLNKRLNSPGIRLPTALHLLATLAQSRQTKIAGSFGLEGLKLREKDTGDVLLLCADAELCRSDGLLDLVAEAGAADGVADFCEGEGGDLHDATHLALGFVYAFCDFSETSEGVGV